MQGKEDLRVIKTKKALSEAFLDLLSKKPFDDITVNELCEAAGIRRATFYKHYSDKINFLTAYVSSLRDTFEREVWKSRQPGATKEYYVVYVKLIIKFIANHPVQVDNIFRSSLFPSVMAIVIEQNFRDTCHKLRESEEDGLNLGVSVEVIASMCAGGVAHSLYQWLKEGKKVPADELAEQIGNLIATIIEHK